MNRTLMTLFCLAAFAPHAWSQTAIPFDEARWRTVGNVEFESADGEDILRIDGGTAYLDRADFRDGTIEFDVLATGDRAFVYLKSRGRSDEEYEDLYFRPHKSGLPDAVQYAPVVQGRSAWQLYHGERGTAAGVFPAGTWTAVRAEFSGDRMAVWLGNDAEPVMTVAHLGHEPARGWLALGGFAPAGSNAEFAAKFRRFRVTHAESSAANRVDTPLVDSNQLTAWRVSPAFDAPSPGPLLNVPSALSNVEWSRPPLQRDGVFEFLRSRQVPPDSRHWAVAADTTLRAERETTCVVSFGYSDEITLIVNGTPLVYQDSSYRFMSPRQDGVMHADQLRAFLPLRRGDNQLRAIVADRFGGWGLSARLLSCEGVAEQR